MKVLLQRTAGPYIGVKTRTPDPRPVLPAANIVERLLADRGVDHVARLLAYARRDLDKAQGKA
jgi:hypothetical protein